MRKYKAKGSPPPPRTYSFIHVIPYDGIGGVELAARSMGSIREGRIDYALWFLFQGIRDRKHLWRTFNPLKLVSVGFGIAKLNPDVVVVSLWRSSIAGLISLLFNPNIRLVTFLHNTKDAHLLDRLVTRLSLRFSDAIWADSSRTMTQRVPSRFRDRCQLISFVTRRFKALPVTGVRPSFIFWGRLAPQKQLDRAIQIFAAIQKRHQDAHFLVIGPDGGALHDLRAQVVALGLADAVTFLGQLAQEQIVSHAARASFYLQTSAYEGMAMSVVEAMQLGLVPVVTPVGEIGSYCTHSENAIVVESDERAVEDVVSLIEDDSRYSELRSRAVSTWEGAVLYRESVLAACDVLV